MYGPQDGGTQYMRLCNRDPSQNPSMARYLRVRAARYPHSNMEGGKGMDSLWRSTCSIPAYPSLGGDLHTEVAVIGGGLCGLLTAYFLQRAGYEVVVLEAGRILSGATEGTTAKITAQHSLIYDRLLTERGPQMARQYAQAQQRALGWYADIIRDEGIDCQFERLPAYLYSIAPCPALEREARAAERLGLPSSLTGAAALPFEAAQALRFDDQAQFHPLRFGAALAKRLTIREQARVTRVTNTKAVTDRGTVFARHIVVATHYPIRNVPGLYFARMHQVRSYVLALKDAADVGGMWLDAHGGFSLRNHEGLLLLGGAGHRTGEHPYASSFRTLRSAVKTFYPKATEVARWSAQDCMTVDSIPFIGRYARTLPHVYVATGFKKWGMTNAMAAAELLCDQIAGTREYPFAQVFSPRRLRKPALTYSLKGTPKCPHLGCALEWNPDTRTWDCPCHGSRFTRNGKVVSGPAVRDGKWDS